MTQTGPSAAAGSGSFAAVDLGASSGRVLLGTVGPAELRLHEVRRFSNRPVTVAGTLHWDVLYLYAETLTGLAEAARLAEQAGSPLRSVGVDSWAVDYGLLDDRGGLLGNPVHYRDRRTEGSIPALLELVPAEQLYAITGLQQLELNTLCQLLAARDSPQLQAAAGLLLIPDLFNYWLTGERRAEFTNASTTQLLDVRAGEWAADLLAAIGMRRELLPELIQPGATVGRLRPEVAAVAGLPAGLAVVAVGSHDTASAVVGVPAESPEFGYISCGTWSLVGVELDAPVLTEASRQANFTNEAGVDGTTRYLRNVMGLWLLQECERSWRAEGWTGGLAELLDEAAALPALRRLIDVDRAGFLAPGDMPARIAARCAETGEPVPTTRAELARCVLDSLALAYRRTLRQAVELCGRSVAVIHIVGGGSQNALLCQLTADACEQQVLAGPTEAAAIGNLLVQARSAGVLTGGLADLRALIRHSQPLRRFEPGGSAVAWAAAEHRLDLIGR